ncbi:19315_t:CDS:1, partial [Gigaspora margarita]
MVPTTQHYINDVKTTIPESITKNSDTKGNDVNDNYLHTMLLIVSKTIAL